MSFFEFSGISKNEETVKRMESFGTLEYDKFLIGIFKQDDPFPRNLINLTFNLDHFTLEQDISNYGIIGRAHING